ncbi:hypothetical protein [uncultured Gemmiger sp.]|uniref:hypothetical protein n=1 Tax=uncultured Gemmiger sp. TaxID=1623490 RepID=UPI0025E1088B|nr:hypothetical protein [uncultured Gemmiger sp.]
MFADFQPRRPRPRSWFAVERAELSAMGRPARAGTALLALLLAVQLAFLCWCNMTQWQSHLDGDSSTQILKVMEIAKAGSLSLPNWNDTTSLLLDTPLMVAALLMPLFGNAFAAYGAGNILLLAAFAYALWQLLLRADCPLPLRLTALFLILTPYSYTEVLGYANCMVVQSAHYLMRALYLVYLLYSLVQLDRRERGFGHLVTWLFTLGLGAWIGLSSGLFLLLIVLLPVVLGFVVRAFAAGKPGLLLSPGGVFLALNLLGFGGGFWVQRFVIHFASRDASIAWNSYTEFLPNLAKVIQGYFKLTGALPSEGGVTVLSGRGIGFGIAFMVAMAVVLGAGLCLWRIGHRPAAACRAAGSSRGLLFACLLGVVGVDTLILTGASLAYGETVYESRYLIFLFVAAVLLLVLGLPWLRRTGGLYAPAVVLLACLAASNAFLCDKGYLDSPTYDFSYAEAVTGALDEAYPEVRVVYMVSDDHDRKVLRLADQSKVYRMVSGNYNPGDYTYYQDGTGLEAGTLLLATDQQFAALDPAVAAGYEKTALPQFWLYMDMTGYSTSDPQPYNVYYCPSGGIDLTALPN